MPVSSAKVAESCKLLENVYRSINIALVNELKVTFDRMGIDVWEVIEAAKTKPFGFTPFYPGPGLGGHCIPLDPFYLSWKAVRIRHVDAVHRARRRDQHVDAAVRGRARWRRRSTTRARASRAQASCVLGSGLQGKHRRRPRIAVVRDHRAAAGSRSAGRLLRPVFPRRPAGTQARPRNCGRFHARPKHLADTTPSSSPPPTGSSVTQLSTSTRHSSSIPGTSWPQRRSPRDAWSRPSCS